LNRNSSETNVNRSIDSFTSVCTRETKWRPVQHPGTYFCVLIWTYSQNVWVNCYMGEHCWIFPGILRNSHTPSDPNHQVNVYIINSPSWRVSTQGWLDCVEIWLLALRCLLITALCYCFLDLCKSFDYFVFMVWRRMKQWIL